MSKAKKATAMFAEGFNCSQAILSAFSPSLGVSGETALKIASALGEGMGMMGEACGAVTGALMVLGLSYGHTSAQDRLGKMRLYDLVKEFRDRFEARNGSIICRKLMGFEGEMPDDLKLAVKMNLHQSICPKFVKDAAEVLDEILYGEARLPESWDADHEGDEPVSGPFGR